WPERDVRARFPWPVGAVPWAEALLPCFTWLRPGRIPVSLSLKCHNTRSGHQGTPCRQQRRWCPKRFLLS
uniref:Uncharacterized protein n=1 Tax=Oryctolagus cuniculus TaxID=9986 RepID=A0A5F9C5G1_RABIT